MSILKEFRNIKLDVWGDFAMFTRPESKVERTTYDIPTPAACRGILNAIYSKPIEFYYEITKIEVMNPIRKIVVKKNELKVTSNPKNVAKPGYYIDADSNRTQRVSTYLCDVYYRIHARIVKREDAPASVNINGLEAQFNRRLDSGKCFYQPYLGVRECLCNFSPVNPNKKPLAISANYGVILYDVFDITNNIPLDTSAKTRNFVTAPSFFRAKMTNGIILVPDYDSPAVLKGGDSNV